MRRQQEKQCPQGETRFYLEHGEEDHFRKEIKIMVAFADDGGGEFQKA